MSLPFLMASEHEHQSHIQFLNASHHLLHIQVSLLLYIAFNFIHNLNHMFPNVLTCYTNHSLPLSSFSMELIEHLRVCLDVSQLVLLSLEVSHRVSRHQTQKKVGILWKLKEGQVKFPGRPFGIGLVCQGLETVRFYLSEVHLVEIGGIKHKSAIFKSEYLSEVVRSLWVSFLRVKPVLVVDLVLD